MSTASSLPPGPPYGDGTPYGYGDAYGYGYGGVYDTYGRVSGNGSVAVDPNSKPIKAKSSQQYLAAMPGRGYSAGTAISLSAEWDEQLNQSSEVLSRRMLLDPQVRSSWNYLKFSVIADGPILTPAVTPEEGRELTPEEQTECDLAKEITDFCLRQQTRIPRPIDEVIGQLFSGCVHRGAACEVLLDYINDGPDKGKKGLTDLPTLPSSAWSFVTDTFTGKTVGVAGWTPDGPRVVEVDHFAIFTWEPKAGDPRGINILDAAYSAWNEKVSLVPERFRHLVQFGSPSVGYKLPPGAQDVYSYDINGNPDYNRPLMSATQQGMQQLSAFRNGGQICYADGGELKVFETSNDGGAFTAAKVDCNREITTAILLTPGATMEAQHDSNANAKTKQDATGILIRRAQARLASVYRTQVLRKLVAPNWGDEVASRLTPLVAFSVEHHDQAQIVSTWSQAGWAPDPAQYPEIDVKAGLKTPRPEVTPEDDAIEDEQDEELEDAVDDEATFSDEREDDADPFPLGSRSLPVIASEDEPCSKFAMMSALGKDLTDDDWSLCQRLEQDYLDGKITREALFAHTPCRDKNGRFMSCGGAGGAKKTKHKSKSSKRANLKARANATKFVRPANAGRNYRVVHIDPKKFDAHFKKDKSYYVGKGGKGGPPGRYEEFQRFHATGAKVEMPKLEVGTDGSASFGNGRHRYAVLRDMGIDSIPVVVHKDQADSVRKRFGSVDQPKARTRRKTTASFSDETDYSNALDYALEVADDLGLADSFEAGTCTPAELRSIVHTIAEWASSDLRDEANVLVGELAPVAFSDYATFGVRDKIRSFFGKALKIVKTASLAAALTLMGPQELTVEESKVLTAQVVAQESYLKNFEAEVVAGSQSSEGIPNRASLYGHAVWGTALETERQAKILSGDATEIRNILGPNETHCPDCPAETAKEWVPINDPPPKGLVPIGQRACMVMCRCSLEYR